MCVSETFRSERDGERKGGRMLLCPGGKTKNERLEKIRENT